MSPLTCQCGVKGECLGFSKIVRQCPALCCLLLTGEAQGRFPALPVSSKEEIQAPSDQEQNMDRWAEEELEFSGDLMLPGIMSVPGPLCGGPWWISSLRCHQANLTPFSRVSLSMSPFPRFGNSPWRLFHSEVVILFSLNSTQQNPQLFIFLNVSSSFCLYFIFWP